MQSILVNQAKLRHNRLERRRGITVQGERILRIAIFVARLRDSSNCNHEYRIRVAKKIADAANTFIAEEVRRANSKKPTDPNYMSWAKVGEAMGLSRNAAYTRYGEKK